MDDKFRAKEKLDRIHMSSSEIESLQQIFISQKPSKGSLFGGLKLVKEGLYNNTIKSKNNKSFQNQESTSSSSLDSSNSWALERPATANLTPIQRKNLKSFRELDMIAFQQDQSDLSYYQFIPSYAKPKHTLKMSKNKEPKSLPNSLVKQDVNLGSLSKTITKLQTTETIDFRAFPCSLKFRKPWFLIESPMAKLFTKFAELKITHSVQNVQGGASLETYIDHHFAEDSPAFMAEKSGEPLYKHAKVLVNGATGEPVSSISQDHILARMKSVPEFRSWLFIQGYRFHDCFLIRCNRSERRIQICLMNQSAYSFEARQSGIPVSASNLWVSYSCILLPDERMECYEERIMMANRERLLKLETIFCDELPSWITRYFILNTDFPSDLKEKLDGKWNQPLFQKLYDEELEKDYVKAICCSTFIESPEFRYRTVMINSRDSLKVQNIKEEFQVQYPGKIRVTLHFALMSLRDKLSTLLAAFENTHTIGQMNYESLEDFESQCKDFESSIRNLQDLDLNSILQEFEATVSDFVLFPKIFFKTFSVGHVKQIIEDFLDSLLRFDKRKITVHLNWISNSENDGVELAYSIKPLEFCERIFQVVKVFYDDLLQSDFYRQLANDTLSSTLEKMELYLRDFESTLRLLLVGNSVTDNIDSLEGFKSLLREFKLLHPTIERTGRRPPSVLELAIVHSDHLKNLLARRFDHLVGYIKTRIASKLHVDVVTLHQKYVSGMKILDSPSVSIESIAILRDTIATIQVEGEFLKNQLFSFRKFYTFCESEQIRLSDEVVAVYFGIFHEPVTLLRTALLKRKHCQDSISHAISYINANISDSIGAWTDVYEKLRKSLIQGSKSKFDREVDIDGNMDGGGAFWDTLQQLEKSLVKEIRQDLQNAESVLNLLDYWFEQSCHMKLDLKIEFPSFDVLRSGLKQSVNHCKSLFTAVETLNKFYGETLIKVSVPAFHEKCTQLLVNLDLGNNSVLDHLKGPFTKELSEYLQTLLEYHLVLVNRIQNPALVPYYETISSLLGYAMSPKMEETSDQEITIVHLLDVKTLINWMFYGAKDGISWEEFQGPLEHLENVAFMEQNTQRTLEDIDRRSKDLSLSIMEIDSSHSQSIVSNLSSIMERLQTDLSSLEIIHAKKLSEHLEKYQSFLSSRIVNIITLLKVWQKMQNLAIDILKLFTQKSEIGDGSMRLNLKRLEDAGILSDLESEQFRIMTIEDNLDELVKGIINHGTIYRWMLDEPHLMMRMSAVERDCEALLAHLKEWLDSTRLACPRLFLCSDEDIIDAIEKQNVLILIPRCFEHISKSIVLDNSIVGLEDHSNHIFNLSKPVPMISPESRKVNFSEIIRGLEESIKESIDNQVKLVYDAGSVRSLVSLFHHDFMNFCWTKNVSFQAFLVAFLGLLNDDIKVCIEKECLKERLEELNLQQTSLIDFQSSKPINRLDDNQSFQIVTDDNDFNSINYEEYFSSLRKLVLICLGCYRERIVSFLGMDKSLWKVKSNFLLHYDYEIKAFTCASYRCPIQYDFVGNDIVVSNIRSLCNFLLCPLLPSRFCLSLGNRKPLLLCRDTSMIRVFCSIVGKTCVYLDSDLGRITNQKFVRLLRASYLLNGAFILEKGENFAQWNLLFDFMKTFMFEKPHEKNLNVVWNGKNFKRWSNEQNNFLFCVSVSSEDGSVMQAMKTIANCSDPGLSIPLNMDLITVEEEEATKSMLEYYYLIINGIRGWIYQGILTKFVDCLKDQMVHSNVKLFADFIYRFAVFFNQNQQLILGANSDIVYDHENEKILVEKGISILIKPWLDTRDIESFEVLLKKLFEPLDQTLPKLKKKRSINLTSRNRIGSFNYSEDRVGVRDLSHQSKSSNANSLIPIVSKKGASRSRGNSLMAEAGSHLIPMLSGLEKEFEEAVPSLSLDSSDDLLISSSTGFVWSEKVLNLQALELGRAIDNNHCVVMYGNAGNGKSLIWETWNSMQNRYTNVQVQTIVTGSLRFSDWSGKSSSSGRGILHDNIKSNLDLYLLVLDSASLGEEWISFVTKVIDSQASSILPLSNISKTLDRPETVKIIIEALSLEHLSPKFLTYRSVAMMHVPDLDKSITWHIKRFEAMMKFEHQQTATPFLASLEVIFRHYCELKTLIEPQINLLIDKIVFLVDIMLGSESHSYKQNKTIEVLESISKSERLLHENNEVPVSSEEKDMVTRTKRVISLSLFAIIWMMGSRLFDYEKVSFEKKIRQVISKDIFNPSKSNSVYDYYYDTSDDSWKLWSAEKVSTLLSSVQPGKSSAAIYDEEYMSMLGTLLLLQDACKKQALVNISYLFIGPPCSRKTSTAYILLDQTENFGSTMSVTARSENVTSIDKWFSMLESNLVKDKQRKIFRPYKGNHLSLFVDDLNNLSSSSSGLMLVDFFKTILEQKGWFPSEHGDTTIFYHAPESIQIITSFTSTKFNLSEVIIRPIVNKLFIPIHFSPVTPNCVHSYLSAKISASVPKNLVEKLFDLVHALQAHTNDSSYLYMNWNYHLVYRVFEKIAISQVDDMITLVSHEVKRIVLDRRDRHFDEKIVECVLNHGFKIEYDEKVFYSFVEVAPIKGSQVNRFHQSQRYKRVSNLNAFRKEIQLLCKAERKGSAALEDLQVEPSYFLSDSMIPHLLRIMNGISTPTLTSNHGIVCSLSSQTTFQMLQIASRLLDRKLLQFRFFAQRPYSDWREFLMNSVLFCLQNHQRKLILMISGAIPREGWQDLSLFFGDRRNVLENLFSEEELGILCQNYSDIFSNIVSDDETGAKSDKQKVSMVLGKSEMIKRIFELLVKNLRLVIHLNNKNFQVIEDCPIIVYSNCWMENFSSWNTMDCIRHVKSLDNFDLIKDSPLQALIKIYQFCSESMVHPTHIFHELIYIYRKILHITNNLLNKRERESKELLCLYEKSISLVTTQIQNPASSSEEMTATSASILLRKKTMKSRSNNMSIMKGILNRSNFLLGRVSTYMGFHSIDVAEVEISKIESDLAEKNRQIKDHSLYLSDLLNKKNELDRNISQYQEWKKHMEDLKKKHDEACLHLRRVTKKNIDELQTYVILPPTMHAILYCLGMFLGGVDVKSQEQLKKIISSHAVVLRMLHVDLDSIPEDRVVNLLAYYKHKDLSERAKVTISSASHHIIDWINVSINILHDKRIGKDHLMKRDKLMFQLHEIEASIEKAEAITNDLEKEKAELEYERQTANLGKKRAKITELIFSHLFGKKSSQNADDEPASYEDEFVELLGDAFYDDPEYSTVPEIKMVDSQYQSCLKGLQVAIEYSMDWKRSQLSFYEKAKEALSKISLDDVQAYLMDSGKWKNSTLYLSMRNVFFSILFDTSFPVSLTQVQHKIEDFMKNRDLVVVSKGFKSFYQTEGFLKDRMLYESSGPTAIQYPEKYEFYLQIRDFATFIFEMVTYEEKIKFNVEGPQKALKKAKENRIKVWKKFLKADYINEEFTVTLKRWRRIQSILEWSVPVVNEWKIASWRLPIMWREFLTFLSHLIDEFNFKDLDEDDTDEAWFVSQGLDTSAYFYGSTVMQAIKECDSEENFKDSEEVKSTSMLQLNWIAKITKTLISKSHTQLDPSTIQDLNASYYSKNEAIYPKLNKGLSHFSFDLVSCLPKFMRMRILNHLNKSEILKFMTVSRQWYLETAFEPEFWRMLAYRDGYGMITRTSSHEAHNPALLQSLKISSSEILPLGDISSWFDWKQFYLGCIEMERNILKSMEKTLRSPSTLVMVESMGLRDFVRHFISKTPEFTRLFKILPQREQVTKLMIKNFLSNQQPQRQNDLSISTKTIGPLPVWLEISILLEVLNNVAFYIERTLEENFISYQKSKFVMSQKRNFSLVRKRTFSRNATGGVAESKLLRKNTGLQPTTSSLMRRNTGSMPGAPAGAPAFENIDESVLYGRVVSDTDGPAMYSRMTNYSLDLEYDQLGKKVVTKHQDLEHANGEKGAKSRSRRVTVGSKGLFKPNQQGTEIEASANPDDLEDNPEDNLIAATNVGDTGDPKESNLQGANHFNRRFRNALQPLLVQFKEAKKKHVTVDEASSPFFKPKRIHKILSDLRSSFNLVATVYSNHLLLALKIGVLASKNKTDKEDSARGKRKTIVSESTNNFATYEELVHPCAINDVSKITKMSFTDNMIQGFIKSVIENESLWSEDDSIKDPTLNLSDSYTPTKHLMLLFLYVKELVSLHYSREMEKQLLFQARISERFKEEIMLQQRNLNLIKEQRELIQGDCVLFASFMVFAGPLHGTKRRELEARVSEILEEQKILCSPQWSLTSFLHSNFSQSLSFLIEERPLLSRTQQENVMIAMLHPRVPIIRDQMGIDSASIYALIQEWLNKNGRSTKTSLNLEEDSQNSDVELTSVLLDSTSTGLLIRKPEFQDYCIDRYVKKRNRWFYLDESIEPAKSLSYFVMTSQEIIEAVEISMGFISISGASERSFLELYIFNLVLEHGAPVIYQKYHQYVAGYMKSIQGLVNLESSLYKEVSKYSPSQLLSEYSSLLFWHQYLHRKSVLTIEERPLIASWKECLQREQKRLLPFTDFVANVYSVISSHFSNDQWPMQEFTSFLAIQIEKFLPKSSINDNDYIFSDNFDPFGLFQIYEVDRFVQKIKPVVQNIYEHVVRRSHLQLFGVGSDLIVDLKLTLYYGLWSAAFTKSEVDIVLTSLLQTEGTNSPDVWLKNLESNPNWKSYLEKNTQFKQQIYSLGTTQHGQMNLIQKLIFDIMDVPEAYPYAISQFIWDFRSEQNIKVKVHPNIFRELTSLFSPLQIEKGCYMLHGSHRWMSPKRLAELVKSADILDQSGKRQITIETLTDNTNLGRKLEQLTISRADGGLKENLWITMTIQCKADFNALMDFLGRRSKSLAQVSTRVIAYCCINFNLDLTEKVCRCIWYRKVTEPTTLFFDMLKPSLEILKGWNRVNKGLHVTPYTFLTGIFLSAFLAHSCETQQFRKGIKGLANRVGTTLGNPIFPLSNFLNAIYLICTARDYADDTSNLVKALEQISPTILMPLLSTNANVTLIQDSPFDKLISELCRSTPINFMMDLIQDRSQKKGLTIENVNEWYNGSTERLRRLSLTVLETLIAGKASDELNLVQITSFPDLFVRLQNISSGEIEFLLPRNSLEMQTFTSLVFKNHIYKGPKDAGYLVLSFLQTMEEIERMWRMNCTPLIQELSGSADRLLMRLYFRREIFRFEETWKQFSLIREGLKPWRDRIMYKPEWFNQHITRNSQFVEMIIDKSKSLAEFQTKAQYLVQCLQGFLTAKNQSFNLSRSKELHLDTLFSISDFIFTIQNVYLEDHAKFHLESLGNEHDILEAVEFLLTFQSPVSNSEKSMLDPLKQNRILDTLVGTGVAGLELVGHVPPSARETVSGTFLNSNFSRISAKTEFLEYLINSGCLPRLFISLTGAKLQARLKMNLLGENPAFGTTSIPMFRDNSSGSESSKIIRNVRVEKNVLRSFLVDGSSELHFSLKLTNVKP